jgi:hypothetical protein
MMCEKVCVPPIVHPSFRDGDKRLRERSNRLVRPRRDSTGCSGLDAVKGTTKGKPKFVGYQDNAGMPLITLAKP